MPPPLFKDMTDQEHGYWKVLSYAGNGNWTCRCACGKEMEVNGQSLRRKTSKSCGCSWGRRTLEEEFWKRIPKGNPDECWPWKNQDSGYGQLTFNRKNMSAHRVCWEIHFGPIPNRLHVLHRCDNPPCCNPSHLFLGTNLDNIEDKINKNRQANGQNVRKNHEHLKGELINTAEFSDEQIMEIRRRDSIGESPTLIASAFGTSRSYIAQIVSGGCWNHLPLLYTGNRKNRPCPKCEVVFPTRAGIFYKHVAKCSTSY